jgi:arginyl-tRNA synthetase
MDNLRSLLAEAVGACGGDPAAASRATLEPPAKAEFGDLATNAAMVCASSSGMPPRDFAEALGERLSESLGERLSKFEVAGPGFLNLTLSDAWYRSALEEVRQAGESFGRIETESEKVLVEFVSANPTGPLTAAGGRHAAYGDSLARLLEFTGHTVEREFYVNDAGAQVKRLGLSIIARARGEEVPEDGYSGDYVAEVASLIPGAEEGDPVLVAQRGVEILVSQIKATLERYGVEFDRWFSEKSLHEGDTSTVAATCGALERSGHAFTDDGALWLRTTDFGDDKDRVLVRSDGEPTYFAADIAYHADKLTRADRLIDVLGADHHGYIARMKAAVASLDDRPERLEMLIMQFVHLIEGGDRSQMSKRRGEFVTLDELLDEIGVDAARWFMLQRSHDTTVDLDLDLARESTAENPVFYVQYAHARACSAIGNAGGSSAAPVAPEGPELHQSERTLIGRIASFPDEIAEAAGRRAPHRICSYALVLAQEFTAFYRDCRIAGAPEQEQQFRLALADTAKDVIATSLGLLGVSAPERL